jgi:hypothetical protein
MGEKSGSGSWMNNPDHISWSLENIFWVKILKFFDADPGWKQFGSGMEKSRIRDKHPGSATLHESLRCLEYAIIAKHKKQAILLRIGSLF